MEKNKWNERYIKLLPLTIQWQKNNTEMVWETAKEDLPELKEKIKKLIKDIK